MTQIKRLSAKGFKSFAGKTELEFGNGFNIVIGPNGSGKSLRGDSRVLLPDGSSKEIKELVDNKIKNSKEIKKLDDGIYTESRDDDYILSVNPTTFRQEYKKITKYIKHNGEKKLYEITTRTGKKITTTGCHSIIIFKEGHLNGARVDELKEKDLIALPRTIRTIPKNDIKIDIQIDSNREFPHLATPNFGRFIGYIIGGLILGNIFPELANNEAVKNFAYFGIILLLFTLGLEVNFSRILNLKKFIIIGGTFQIIITIISIFILSLIFKIQVFIRNLYFIKIEQKYPL